MGSSSKSEDISRAAVSQTWDLKDMEIKTQSETPMRDSVDEIEKEVETFLTLVYAQQIKEKNKKIVSARSSMLQGGKVETAVVPIISSATNIRDYYVRQIEVMK